MATLFQMIDAAVKGGNKVQGAVRAAVAVADWEVITDCANQIEASYPVRKDENGKDSNKDARNDRLRALRMALMRAGREIEKRLTVKKVEGVYQVVIEDQEQDNGKQSGGADEGSSGGNVRDIDPDSKEADELWAAVDTVLANLGNPAVLSAIRSGLEALAKG